VDHPRDPRPGSRPALSARIARWLRPPRTLRPTRAGWIFFALTFGVGFAALNTGNNLLYLVLSLMLAFLVLSGVLSESALRGIHVRRRLPREIFAEAPATVVLEIENAQRRVPAFAVVVEDLHARRRRGEPSLAGRVFALRVPAGGREIRAYRLCAARRGALRFAGFRVSTRFPFGLFSKALAIDADAEALVYPPVDRVETPPDFGAAREGGERITGAGGTGADVSGLREYAPGDAARRIHWRASMRRRALLVRQVESERDAEVEVRLRTRGVAADEAFEQRVRWAASEIVAFLEAGTRVALRTDVAHFPADCGAGHRARLLGFLARVQPGAVAP
jgi:uncharacterized protein (DUF58 family)